MFKGDPTQSMQELLDEIKPNPFAVRTMAI
jgi:hypothetical protein